MSRYQVNELLDMIVEGDDMDRKVERALRAFTIDPTLKSLLEMASDPALKIQDIPEGFPAKYRPDSAIPAGIADTNIRTEFRRIGNFLPGRSLKTLTPKQREEHWTQMLTGLHWKEAEIMTMVKDQTLLDHYPDLWVILPAVGIDVLINTKKEETSSKKTKTSKKEKSNV